MSFPVVLPRPPGAGAGEGAGAVEGAGEGAGAGASAGAGGSGSKGTGDGASQEDLNARARAEAETLARVSQLKRQGMWSTKRLPKCQEPPRRKVHWDYLLAEAAWLAHDFREERKWKRTVAKKLVRAVAKFHADRELRAQRKEREEALRLRRLAHSVARQVRAFWQQVEKVARYKYQTKLQQKLKGAREKSLDFMVKATERYSTMLAKDLGDDTTERAVQASSGRSSMVSTPAPATPGPDLDPADEEFQPISAVVDDEATLEEEERLARERGEVR